MCVYPSPELGFGCGWSGLRRMELGGMGGKTPLLGNFLWPMAGEVTLCRTESVPTTGRQVVRGSLGMEREAEGLPVDHGHFGLGGAWHSEVGERLLRSPEELP